MKYVVATPASDDVGPNTNSNIGPVESAPNGCTPALPRDATRSVRYASHPHRSPAFFSMATGTSSTPTQANEALSLPSQHRSDDVGPNTNSNIGPVESAPNGCTPALPRDATRSVRYASHPHRSPAFFSMATTTSSTPTQTNEAPSLPSQHPSTQPAAYPPAPYPTHPDSGIQDAPSWPINDQPGMQAPPLPLPPQISEELDNNDALPTYPYSSTIPPPPTVAVAPPVETVDDPSMHVSALTDAPPPSYYDLFTI